MLKVALTGGIATGKSYVLARLKAKGFRVEADFSSDKLGAKIRNARGMRHPYMLVIGEKDAEAGTVSVRSRDHGELGARRVHDEA